MRGEPKTERSRLYAHFGNTVSWFSFLCARLRPRLGRQVSVWTPARFQFSLTTWQSCADPELGFRGPCSASSIVLARPAESRNGQRSLHVTCRKWGARVSKLGLGFRGCVWVLVFLGFLVVLQELQRVVRSASFDVGFRV